MKKQNVFRRFLMVALLVCGIFAVGTQNQVYANSGFIFGGGRIESGGHVGSGGRSGYISSSGRTEKETATEEKSSASGGLIGSTGGRIEYAEESQSFLDAILAFFF